MEELANKLTLRHLRVVIAIADENSMIRAAKQLNMTQSAVTKSLQSAEFQLGVLLFSRKSGGLAPTIYGEALIAQARLITSQLDHAAQEIADLRDGTGGRIAIGTLLAASPVLLPRAIALLRQKRPKLVISVMEGTDDLLIPALQAGKLDFIVGRIPDWRQRSDLQQEVLLTDKACIVVRPGHPLAGRKDLNLKDLLKWDWILPPPETTLRGQVDRAYRENHLDPPVPVVESISLLMNRSLLLHTNYLNVWSWQVASEDAAAGRIVILPVTLPSASSPVGITSRLNARLSPAAEMLVQTLKTVAVEMEAGVTRLSIPLGTRGQK